MSDDITKIRGASAGFKDDRGGAVLIPHPVLGIVKNNIDPTRSGKIEVYLNRLNSNDPDSPAYWTTVSYLSPFFGSTPNTSSSDGYGDYVGNPNSYGFWATPPDVGTEVVCVFLNGDPNFGYYIGSVPKPGLTHMVPAIGASDNIVPNSGEANSYGGATRLPVSEINNANDKQENNTNLTNQPRPIHSYQAAMMFKQGLLRDPDRGPISSSSVRESPSRVFGMSTPGRPIYQGGYDDESIGSAVQDNNIPNKNFQVVGRRGGHSFVMDDGDLTGKDQLMRLRTATGHQILMNDSAETLFIIHANGQSYIELGKEGTIDMYSTNSVNIRTQGDLNLHADNNINIHAVNDLNISATNLRMETSEEMTQKVGTDFKNDTKGDHTTKVDGGASIESQGPASLASADTAYVNGPSAVNLNTGSTSIKPKAVEALPIIAHSDTLSDPTTGYSPAPGKLESITSRAPAHTPWSEANKGVNVESDLSTESNLPEEASEGVKEVNDSVGPMPKSPTSTTLASTVPAVPTTAKVNSPAAGLSKAKASVDKATETARKLATTPSAVSKSIKGSLISQLSLNTAFSKIKNIAMETFGIVSENGKKIASLGILGLSVAQLVKSGFLKPGSDVAINAAIQSGKTIEQAIPPAMLTGKDGVNTVSQITSRTDIQVAAASSLLDASKNSLISAGVITGNENPTETSGLILSAASAGLGPTLNYIKSASGQIAQSTTNIPNSNEVMNPLSNPVPDLISGGQLAAKLATVSMGPGSPTEMFDTIKSTYVPLKANEPQVLSEPILSASQEAKATQDAMFKPKLKTSQTAAETAKLAKTGETNIFDTVVDMCTPKPTSSQSLINNAAMSTIANDPSGAAGTAVAAVREKLGSNTSLTSLASTELTAAENAKVNAEIMKVSSNGPVTIKLPTTSTDTLNVSGLAATSISLLGDTRIPPINFGNATVVTNTVQLNRDALVAAATAKMDQARMTYTEMKARLGESNPEVISALQKWKIATKDYEALVNL